MISKAELQYVNNNAKNAPFPGVDYAHMVIDRLMDALAIYEDKYRNKNYSLILSNGEEMQFSILPKNLCHMLGIDYKSITSEYMTPVRESVLDLNSSTYTTSYELLSRIISNRERVIENDSQYGNNKLLNYYKILIKSSVFSKLSNFTSFNFGCINFDKETYNAHTGKFFNPMSTKFLFTSSDEALIPYFMIGMTKDNGGDLYVPETLFAAPDFIDFFCSQELLIPIQLLIDDKENLSKIVATSEEKLNILKMYKSIIQGYSTHSFINIFNDYETVLRNDAIQHKQ